MLYKAGRKYNKTYPSGTNDVGALYDNSGGYLLGTGMKLV